VDTALVLEKPSEAEYLNCIRCGLCLSVCPTYREHLSETASPRGRVVLARKGLEGDLELTPNLIEQMYACMACLACNDVCPVGIRPAELALSMRYVQEQLHPAPWKRPLFESLIPRPGRMEVATLPLRLYQSLRIRDTVHALGLGRLLPPRLRDMEAMLPHLPRRPLRPRLPEVVPAIGDARYRVGFFLGCAQSLLFSEDSAAAIRVLARNGAAVFTPREAVCCGMPARGYGRLDLVRQQARHNIAAFEQRHVDLIVTDCATCGSTLKDYGRLLEDDAAWAARAAGFSRQVRDISEFLASIPLEKPQGQVRERVTYHDPCHLLRAQGVRQEPRHLLSLIDGLEYVELPEADWCCGSAGSQLISHYETSIKVMQRKIDRLAQTQATVVASGCPGCQMQLTTGVRRRGLAVRVVHPVSLLARAYEESHED
jgi:glycolate oxidase iron-sulfur subunit